MTSNGYLQGLTKSATILGGQLTIEFMPYNTVRVRLYWENMKKITDEVDDWHLSQQAFVTVFGAIEDISANVATDELNAHSLGILHYWSNRNGDFTHDWALFQAVFPFYGEIVNELYDAYNGTRFVLPKATEILQGGRPDAATDPEVLSAGGKSSKKKSSR